MSTQESKDYARGYAAGRKRQKVDIDREHELKVKNENWNRAFLAAYPALIQTRWEIGGKDSNTLKLKAQLARIAADEAVMHMRSNVP